MSEFVTSHIEEVDVPRPMYFDVLSQAIARTVSTRFREPNMLWIYAINEGKKKANATYPDFLEDVQIEEFAEGYCLSSEVYDFLDFVFRNGALDIRGPKSDFIRIIDQETKGRLAASINPETELEEDAIGCVAHAIDTMLGIG